MDRNKRKAYKLSLTPISCPLSKSFIFFLAELFTTARFFNWKGARKVS